MSRWSTRDKVHGAVLLFVTVGVVAHQAALWQWYVEDSAISFAYARNLIQGEGLAAYAGGERVEGYSNPTWVLVLAATQLVGFDPFFSTKFVQAAMAAATVPLVYLTMREATGKQDHLGLVAVVFLGASTQFAIFGTCGLENALLNLLIAAGILRTLVELRAAAFPWSSLVWLLVALTRPEGLLYAAVAGGCTALFQLHARRGLKSTILWLVTFFVPFGLYQLWHYLYFAWPLPNTFYAKVDEGAENTWRWNRKGWNWTRSFFHEMAHGYFLPVWLIAILGEGRVRWIAAIALFVVVGGTIELSHDQRWLLPVMVGGLWATFLVGLRASQPPPPRWLPVAATFVAFGLLASAEILRHYGFVPNKLPVPAWFLASPPCLLAALAVILPFASFGTRGWQLRVMSWSFCCTVILFAIYVQGDWMKGWRWYATAAVPGAFLFAFGVDGLVRFVEEMFGWKLAVGEPNSTGSAVRPWSRNGTILATVLVLMQLPANIRQTWKIAEAPDASPRGVRTRADYVDRSRDRLHIEGRLVDLDVDQGAHLWWSDFEMMDIAGLVDLPLGHHKFDSNFVQEYIFEERRPHFAHIHAQWASASKVPTHPEWRRDYFEIPAYPVGKLRVHPGTFVRRDLVVAREWPHSEDGKVQVGSGIVVYPPWIPSEPGASRKVYLELGVSSIRPRRDTTDFRTILFASDGSRLASWDLPPGYDWLPPTRWKNGEVFVGKFDLQLPETLTPGTWDLGVVILDRKGTVIPGPETDAVPRMARGEILFPGALTILSLEDRSNAAIADREAAMAEAAALDCDAAETSWFLARKHRAGEAEWTAGHLPPIREALAACWARSADGAERQEQVRRLVKARTWDWWNPEYRARAEPLAEVLHAEGLVALEDRDWERAYRLFSDAVDLDRSRAWSRRYAEEARVQRLGIQPEDAPATPAEGGAPAGPEAE